MLNLVDGVSTLLKDHHPQQQGLRPLEEIPQSTLLPPQRPSSTTTRIKTSALSSKLPNLILAQRPSSTTTRIKTGAVATLDPN